MTVGAAGGFTSGGIEAITVPENWSKSEIRFVELFFRFLRSYGTFLVGTVGVISIWIASPYSGKTVTLDEGNPVFIVDGKKFFDGILNAVKRGSMDASIIQNLTNSLGIDLWAPADIAFFRKWHPSPVQWNEEAHWESAPSSADDKNHWERGNLGMNKRLLGITDPESMVEVGKLTRPGQNIFSLEDLDSGIPQRWHTQMMALSHSVRTSQHTLTYFLPDDLFYAPFQSLPLQQKNEAYELLRYASQSYSWFYLQNHGNDDEYDIRITANVVPGNIDMDALNYYGITVETQLVDAVLLKVGDLAPSKMRYKLLLFHGDPEPVRLDDVRMSTRPFVYQLGAWWPWLYGIPLALSLMELLCYCQKRNLFP